MDKLSGQASSLNCSPSLSLDTWESAGKKTVADHWLRGLSQWFNLKADVHNYPLMFIVI